MSIDEIILIEPKEWHVVRFDKEYGADIDVQCGSCGESFTRTVPPVAHPIAICPHCRARNELHTNFADLVQQNWWTL